MLKTIGIISPANSIVGEKSKKTFIDGVQKLKEAGFDVLIGKNVYSTSYFGYCGTIEEKLEDLYYMINCEKVDYIMCSTGGVNSNVILDYINYEMIQNNKKKFIGNSNVVLLFNALFEKCNIKSYIGPNVKTLGKLPTDFSLNCIKEKLMNSSLKILMEKENIIIKNGKVEGIAIGGNIASMRRILSTPFFPKLRDYILYVEADFNETNYTEFDSIIKQYLQAGIIENAKGIILGSYQNNDEDVLNFMKEEFKNFDGPVVVCENLGHNVSNNMLPIGKKIILDTYKNEIVELDE